jgi:hypothetical protein
MVDDGRPLGISDSELAGVPEYRGSRRTLFVPDRLNGEWLICAWDGTEVVLPTSDLAGFLRHCLLHSRSLDPVADAGDLTDLDILL